MWIAYHNYRTLTTLEAVVRLTLHIRRCLNPGCTQFRKPYRPEQAGRWALPKHEFGLDVIAQVGTLRYAHHRSVTEIHHSLRERQLVIAPRTVTYSWRVTMNCSVSPSMTPTVESASHVARDGSS
jgi:hypothetical protein